MDVKAKGAEDKYLLNPYEIILAVCLLALIAYFGLYESFSFSFTLPNPVAVIAWFVIVLIGALLLNSAIYFEIFTSAIDTLMGGPDPDQGLGSPKSIFDHLRNYFICSLVMSLGLLIIKNDMWTPLNIYGFCVVLLGLALKIVNLFHGARASSQYLNDKAAAAKYENGSFRLKYWNTGIPKIPVYMTLPAVFFLGVAQTVTVVNNFQKGDSIINLLCADENISKSVKETYCG